jgi:hypothetical protein
MTVESFFQNNTQEALLAQVNWVQKELRVPDQFFSNVLRIDDKVFLQWKTEHQPLPEDAQEQLRHFWRVLLHILSLLNFNLSLVRLMLVHTGNPEHAPSSQSGFEPPWVGTSMKSYLEQKGSAGIEQVDRWIQGIRFADSY